MPTSDQILSGLGAIANGWRLLAILWHAYFAVLALGLVAGARPSRRVAGILLGLPLLSVGALAWGAGNPFNGSFFTLSGVALLAIAVRLPPLRIELARWRSSVPGALMFAFGWGYPHFLDTPSWVPYLYAAPTGLIPCPTLSIVIGLALIVRGLGARGWSALLAATGLFYGVFGALGLGVTLDWALAAGALVLLLTAFRGSSPRGGRRAGERVL